mgnify:FL=1
MAAALGASGSEVILIARPVSQRAWGPWVLALLPAVFVGVWLWAPLLRLLAEGWGNSALFWWHDPYLRSKVSWTLLQALITTGICALVGLPMAWVLARCEFKGRALWLRLLMLPFVMPTLVAAMGILALWGPRGWLAPVLSALNIHLEDSPALMILGHVFFNVGLVIRASVDGLARVSLQQLSAARSLGSGPWLAFWRVEFPLMRGWLFSALCLVFLYCFTGFGLALILGGQAWGTIEVEIYTLIAHELQLQTASILAMSMLMFTFGVAWAYAKLEQRLRVRHSVEPVVRVRPYTPALKALVLGVHGMWWWLCGLPLLALLFKALEALAVRQAWVVWLNEDTALALFNSLRFTTMGLVLATTLGVLHALATLALQQVNPRWASLWRAGGYAPLLVSPVALAFGMLLMYPQWLSSLPLLVCAYALLAYPMVARSLTSALDQLPLAYGQAARTMGASPLWVFWRVTLPLVRPGLQSGMAFAAATMLGEFAVALFFSRPEWTTLTTLIYQHLGRPGSMNLDATWVLSASLMVFALLVFALIDSEQTSHQRSSR